MPLFNFWGNYAKPGPGVSKDEPEKAAPIRFFELYFRKFGKLVQLNLIFCLPTAVAALLMVLLYFSPTHVSLSLDLGGAPLQLDLWNLYVVPLPAILLSPFVAGLTYVTRNFARAEHAFVWSDFWEITRKNWRYFLLNGAVVYGAYLVLSFALAYYYHSAQANSFYFVPFWFCFLLALLFLFAQYYVPIMFVTFDLTFRQVYRNAAIFVLAGLFRNLLITVILAALGVLIFAVIPVMPVTVTLFIVMLLFWVFSFVAYLINFTIYPVIDRYLIQPAQKREEERYDALHRQSQEAAQSDGGAEAQSESEYVFVQGKMVKRSQLKPGEKPEE